MKDEIYLAGIGACTSVGADLWSSAAAVRGGVPGFAEHPYMIDKTGEAMIVARAPYLDLDTPLFERATYLAARASHQARETAFGPHLSGPALAAFIGLPREWSATSEELTSTLVDQLAGETPGTTIESLDVFCCGHSAGLLALKAAVQELLSGRAEWCLVGGVDSYLDPEVLEALDESGQLHSPSNAWGFIPGEGAGFCLLTSVLSADRYGSPPLGRILSASSAHESNLIRTDSVCVGAGLSNAVREAVAALPDGTQVDAVICDMNGDAYRADEYGFTVARTGQRFRDATDVLTPADCWGDVGAASGILYLGLAIAAGSKGYAKGRQTLVWTSSDTGERTAAIVEIPVSRE